MGVGNVLVGQKLESLGADWAIGGGWGVRSFQTASSGKSWFKVKPKWNKCLTQSKGKVQGFHEVMSFTIVFYSEKWQVVKYVPDSIKTILGT